MTNSPEAVTLYVPLMKETNMTWEEIKRTPSLELEGILAACSEYNLLHSMDGYEAKDISDMAKHRPEIRNDWNKYMAQRRKYERMAGRADINEENRREQNISELKNRINN